MDYHYHHHKIYLLQMQQNNNHRNTNDKFVICSLVKLQILHGEVADSYKLPPSLKNINI